MPPDRADRANRADRADRADRPTTLSAPAAGAPAASQVQESDSGVTQADAPAWDRAVVSNRPEEGVVLFSACDLPLDL